MKHESRDRGCGASTLIGQNAEGRKFFRFKCNCWDCAFCGPRKAGRYKRAICSEAERLKLCRFLTLTLDPKKLSDNEDAVRYLRETFNKLRTYLNRRFNGIQFICVLEFQKNGMPHLHCLISHYIEQKWIQRAWSNLGGGSHVDIRRVDIHRVSRYLSKYLTKEMLLAVPKGARRVTTSRGITLAPKKKPQTGWVWKIVSKPIEELFRDWVGWAEGMLYCKTGELLEFKVPARVFD